MSISRIVRGLLLAPMATAVFTICQNAAAQQCGCYTGGGAGCPATFAATSYGSPTVESCNLPYYWSSGAGAATLLQDESSSTSGAYAAEATSHNNVAILAYTGGGPAAIVAQSQTTTVPTETSAISGIAGSGYGGYFTSPGTGTSGTNAALYGNATGTGNTATGVLGTGAEYGVYGYSADAIGIYGNSTNGWGVVGTLTGHLPGTTAGVYGDGNTNDGVYGTSSSGNGVVGNSSSGTGVYGKATSAYGVLGQVTTGTGVFGYSTSSGNGVYGRTNSTATNVAAVTGYNDNGSSAGLAGLFQGNVTITGTLTVDNIDMTGSCTGNACTSDIRLKQNVRPLTDALDTLLQFKGVTFEWKNPQEHQNHTGKQTGVIAQDVEKVFPQWVGEDKKGFKTVDPDARTVLALQVEAFREQQAEINDLKAEVRDLKANRRPLISGLMAEGGLFGIGFVTMAGAFVVSRRKRSDGVQG